MEDLCASSLKFFSVQRLCCADVLPLAEARARIEVAVLSFLRTLTSHDPAISHLPLEIVLIQSKVFSSFGTCVSSNQVSSMVEICVPEVWKAMETCYQILLQDKRVTQRELYYKLLSTS
ncbi:SP-RING-type domain-containing protein [Psidium guajava]|nr:SP-RING-type domain-containing protein [Psidium guajava]